MENKLSGAVAVIRQVALRRHLLSPEGDADYVQKLYGVLREVEERTAETMKNYRRYQRNG